MAAAGAGKVSFSQALAQTCARTLALVSSGDCNTEPRGRSRCSRSEPALRARPCRRTLVWPAPAAAVRSTAAVRAVPVGAEAARAGAVRGPGAWAPCPMAASRAPPPPTARRWGSASRRAAMRQDVATPASPTGRRSRLRRLAIACRSAAMARATSSASSTIAIFRTTSSSAPRACACRAAACWNYSGSNAGRVHLASGSTCYCPSSLDPAWY
jgi:hypothetical protein